jgi:hypothetical protein
MSNVAEQVVSLFAEDRLLSGEVVEGVVALFAERVGDDDKAESLLFPLSLIKKWTVLR